MKICPQCKKEFTPKSKSHRFCEKPCYYKYNNKRLNEIYKEKRKKIQENPTFPKFIDDEGNEYELNFDPAKDHNRFDRFKRSLKQKTTD